SAKRYVACLGVYIDVRWILASKSCHKHIKVIKAAKLYMGSPKMDCSSGQSRRIKMITDGKDLIYINPNVAFTLSPQVSTMSFTKDPPNKLSSCVVFCNRRVIRYKGGQSSNKTMCDRNLWKHRFDIVYCKRKITSKNKSGDKCPIVQQVIEPSKPSKNKACGSVVEKNTPCEVKDFQVSAAPIICKDKLAGFVQVKQTNYYVIKYKQIRYSVQEIDKVTEKCCS
ncbi:hypothetical protein Trydic_g18465, partial [Trypoxylus dichotomus]